MKRIDEKGQILIFVTLAFVLLGLFTGLAIDLGRGYLVKARLSRVVDAAALAGAKALKGQASFENEAQTAACDAALMNGIGCSGSSANIAVSFVDKPVSGGASMRFVQVTGQAIVSTSTMRLLGLLGGGDFSKLNVQAFAEAGPERPVDLMLVLDRSGSMKKKDGTGTKKIVALKTAMSKFLDNNFSSEDQVGMVSFATRGCGKSSGKDSKVKGDCTPDKPLGTSLSAVQAAVSKLVSVGGTNTMEALRTAGAEINATFSDLSRATSRKAILLVTDGQPTFMRRFNDGDCKSDPFKGSTLPFPGDGNGGGGPLTKGCTHGVPSTGFDNMIRTPLNNPTCLMRIPGNKSSCSNFPTDPGKGRELYKNVIRSTRDNIRGAMFEANKVRDYGSAGGKDVFIFVIAIGRDQGPGTSNPQSSLDENAKCLLARIANDPDTISVCNLVYKTGADDDTHKDLRENWPCGSGPCIDASQRQGKVFTVDVNGNVAKQLKDIFNVVAALLKPYLTI